MGGLFDSLFGGKKSKSTTTTAAPTVDPTIAALNSLKLNLATQTAAGGISSSMAGYINKVVIPSTVNTLTAAGLGRSGAVGEAVANATLSQGTQFIESLLSGVPSGLMPGGGTTTSTTTPGGLDWLQALIGIGGGVAQAGGKGGFGWWGA